jgi:type II restriction/modification system DNA methylase subunit YeeA
MNKTLIKNFAIAARVRLIQMAIDNAGLVGVTKDKITEAVQKGADFEIYKTAAGTDYTITGNKIKQRKNLVERINKIGFEQVMEETAYTWFNRIIAIRYMEVNDYLPTRVRVLSSETAGKKEPDIITMAPDNVDLNFTSREKDLIRDLKAKQKMDEAFQLLFIKQCNELNKYLPKLFEKTSAGALDYTELLFSLSFIQTDGVVARLLEIDEEDFKDQVQIIGWMYQYYNTELKDDTFAKLKKNVKITKERIPAATQLFTPDWIVRYMVENSLGRLYAQSNTAQSEEQTAQMMGWKYYLPEAEQTEEVQKKLAQIRQEQIANFNLENIKVLDPCMGSGHILVYAFDVLVQMYKNAGYNERDAAQKIMQNNIFGLDIDNRATQLAYFALMMKGRQYDRRFFERDIEPNVYAIQESNGIENGKLIIEKCTNLLEPRLLSGVEATLNYLINTFHDAKEYGSIIDVESKDYDMLKNTILTWKQNHEATLENVLVETDIDDFITLCQIAKVMSAKYDVVVTNPPYMGSSGMGEHLSNFVKKNYPDSKSDLFAVFIEKCGSYAKKTGLVSMITQHAWMFLSSYEKLREKLNTRTTLNMAHLGARAFDEIGGEVVQTTAFVGLNKNIANYKANYKRLVDFAGEAEKEAAFADETNTYFAQQENFAKIPGMPVAYWVSKKFLSIFNSRLLFEDTISDGQNKTGNNAKFVRDFWEVNKESVGINKKWLFYAKGGGFRKWYGNLIDVIDWSPETREFYHKDKICRIIPEYLWYKKGITWCLITSNLPSFRVLPENATFDVGGSSVFFKDDSTIPFTLGLLNSQIFFNIAKIFNPTLNFQVKDIRSTPVIFPSDNSQLAAVNSLVEQNISLSKADWDSFETSWDFAKNPLLSVNVDYKEAADNSILISDCYAKWKKDCSEHFATLKSNEEELNRIFIEIYGLQDELTPEVQDKDVTVRLADRTRDIKSFISYAVGCMFGRYSLSKEGLAYAGGDMDMNNYKYFIPDADNVIPVTDEEYFSDDIVTRFVEFVRQVYGESTLEENLRFIAESLTNKGDTPKEVIRTYFLNDFYKDHCKTYQKRPIYWMFDSGKENGFKALIYMHRYDNQTLARVRTDYLHKLQTMYEAALVQCTQIAENPATAARDKALAIKRIAKITKQLEETKLYDQALGHIASQYIDIDLDDGVNVNYEKFQGVQVAREGQKAIKIDLLAKRG